MFEYKGGQYTYEDLQKEAEKQGVDFAEFMGKMKKLGMTQAGLSPATSLNGPQEIDDGFDDDMGILQSLTNTFENLETGLVKQYYETKLNVADFIQSNYGHHGGGSKAAAWILGEDVGSKGEAVMIDPDNGREVSFNKKAYEIDGHDAIENKRYYELDKLRKAYAYHEDLGMFSEYSDEEFAKLTPIKTVYKNTGEDLKEVYAEGMQNTIKKSWEQGEKMLRISDKGITGFTDALKKGELDDMFALSLDFMVNTTKDAGLAYVTGGLSMATQIYGAGYSVYNDEKSKLLYGEDDPDRFKKLILNDEDEVAIPGALAGLGFIMERAGYKGMTKEIMKRSFTGKKAVSLFLAGNMEGWTEYGQGLTERMNKNLGQGMSVVDGVVDVAKYMWTEEAFDQYFAGLIGGTGLSTGGSIVQGALRSDENSNIFINKNINATAALLEGKARAKTEKEQKKYDDAIQVKQTELKEYLETNKKLGDYLDATQITDLTSLVNNRRDIAKKIRNLQKGFKKGVVSKDEYNSGIKDLKGEITSIDANVKTIKTEANMVLLKQDLDAGSAFVGNVDGLAQDVYDTPAEFFAALEQEYKALGKEMPNFEGVNIHGLKIGNKFLINAKVAAEVNAVATSTHEVLHGIVKSTVQADDGTGHLSAKGEIIVNSFINQLSRKEKGLIEGLLKNGKYKTNKDGTDKDFKEYGEEYLTMYAQLAKEGQFTKNNIQKAGIWFGRFFNKETEFKKISFKDGKSTKAFLDAYAGGNKVALEQSVALAKEGVKMKQTVEFSKESTNAINELGKVDKDGNNLEEKGTGNFYYQAEADDIVRTIEEKGYLDGLIRSKYKAEKVPPNFVKQVMSELSAHIKAYKPERKNESGLFGWINSQISNKANAVYNREYKVDDEMKGAKDIGKTTKEGEVKVQVAAEKSAEMEAFEQEDLSPAAQAKKKADKARGKEKVESKFRRQIGIETGGDLYNKVLDTARKSLLRAYEVGTSVRNIQRKLRDEANVYLFKDIKNFLGTTKYISNLKEFRVPIMNSIFTADLVQMERNMAEGERVFTRFVRKLTSKADVQAAVDQNLLPVSALNIIDKGTAVSLYEKANPTETQFMSYFDIPTINPKTGARSGTRGTRKDQLAKNMAGALSYDATMEVAQEPEVAQKRADLAGLKGESLAKDNLEVLAAAIGRNIDVKFSKGNVDQNLAYHLDQILSNYSDNMFVMKDGRITLKNPIERVFGRGPKKMTQKDQDLVAALAYRIHNDARFERPADKNGAMQKYLLKKIAQARKNGKTINLGIANQIENEKTLKKAFSSLFTFGKGKGDIYANIKNVVFGLEAKLGVAQGVSQTVGYVKNGLSFTNFNETKNKDGKAFDDVIKEKISEKLSEMNEFLEQFDGVGPIDPNNLTDRQVELLYPFRHLFQVEAAVDADYIQWAYGNGKYKASPQGMMITEGKLYLMKTGNEQVDKLHRMAVNEYNKGKENKIPLLELDSKEINVIVSLDIKSGKLKHRIRPLLIGADFKQSNVDINNSSVAIDLGTAMEKTAAMFSKSKNIKTMSSIVKLSRSANNPTKGITVLDFDDTLATSKSLIRFTRPDGTKGTLNAEQYASTYQELTELGYKWDFSEFTKVVDGKTAPLFNKAMKLQGKFGSENMFVLTARPAESAAAIHAFLKANGLNIPLKNITGLANSTAEAKALWMAEKVGEGYNDFYFADDALQNVKAVKNMLDQLDVKSKVQQARVKFSKSMDPAFNKMLERTTGVPADQVISQARATKRGGKKGRLELFVPPSAEDFLGLLYKFAGKGEQGDADLAFLKQSLIDPLNRAYTELNETKQAIADDYRNLKKLDPETAKKLRKQSPDADFTYGDAVRVYLWNKSGIEVPGLSETDQNTLSEMVTSDPKLQQFADQLGLISRQEDGYVTPGEYWQVGDIRNDLDDATSKVGRKQFFTEFIENSEIIFSQENLQKIEAIYGSNFREALENILYRTKTGSNKSTGSTRLESGFIKWINGSVAATMFVNTRSALLQTLSSVNFTNWGDNNPYKMAKAFANQKQFWADFSMLFNSAKLKQRRSGLGMDINANELTTYMAKSKSSPKALLNWLLQKGFLPTQMADSFAISIGGASFYRNRVNTYLKQGMDAKQAEEKAFQDFSEIAEATQQSARPDMVSQQQASPLGKFILNFQNTPMQYTRLIKKATIDLIKGRGDIKTNISRIVYYGAVQNMIFYGLQTALFAMMFSDDEEDEEFFQKKKERVANGMVDSLLRGTGIGGAAIATAKNMIIKFLEQKEKGYNKDESAVLVQFLNFSPVVGIKAQKIVSATKGYNYNEKVIDHMSTFDINNPVWSSVSSVVEGTTNIPLNRLHKKVSNVRAGLDAENEAWQRLSVLLGFSTWDVGIENREIDAIKEELKAINKSKKKKKKKKERFGPTIF